MLTHRNKKPYECKAEGCGKSYCDARSLRRHTENHHSSLAMTPTTPNQSLSSSTGSTSSLSLSPATASGKTKLNIFIVAIGTFYLIYCALITIVNPKILVSELRNLSHLLGHIALLKFRGRLHQSS